MRMYLKNKSKIRIRFRKVKVLIIVLLLIFLFGKLSSNISKYILNYSVEMVNKYVIDIINNSIDNKVFNTIKDNKLYLINRNSNNEIETIDYNTYVLNNILKEVNTKIYDNISLYDDKVMFYIPIGTIFDNVFLNNMGFKVPIRVKLIDRVISNIEIEIKEYGINNSLVQINLVVGIKGKVILPLISDSFSVSTKIPITYQIITGKVPDYYGNSIIKSSSVV